MRVISATAFCVEVPSFYLVECLQVLATAARTCVGDADSDRPDCELPWTKCLTCPVLRHYERAALQLLERFRR